MTRTALAALVGLALAAALSGCAQLGAEEHQAHHPPGPAGRQDGMGPRGAMADAGGRFGEQMRRMQDMHRRMQAAATPAERQALMDEHMRVMQSGMEMMREMGPMGPMGPMGAGAPSGPATGRPGPAGGPMAMPGAQGAPGAADGGMSGMGGMGGMGGMMAMHDAMQRRMAMMEMMMQMMVDREAAMPRK